MIDGCESLIAAAGEHIDMRSHEGSHPRIGAVDVCPLVALRPEDGNLAIETVRQVAKRISTLKAGGWFYGLSAARPEYALLANLRRGQYEGLAQRSLDFDFGSYHPRFGAMALGARDFLLAYNVNLSGLNASAAKAISAQIREQNGGGMPGLRSIGWDAPLFGCSQVSCNITDLNRLSLKEVYDRVDALAADFGMRAAGSELIGMAPLKAFRGFRSAQEGADYLGLSSVVSFDASSRIIEERFH
jgi:glutamate formiminotransferase